MNRIMFFFAQAFVACVAFSQPQKGDRYLGESFQLNSENDYHYRWFNIKTSPGFGVMVTEKWLFGGLLKYNFSRTAHYMEDTLNYKTWQNRPGMGFFTTRYFKMSEKFFIHVSLASHASMDFYTQKYSSGINTNPSLYFEWELNPGVSYFIKPGLALNANFGILRYRVSGLGVSQNSDLDIYLNANSLYFGLQWFIRKKSK